MAQGKLGTSPLHLVERMSPREVGASRVRQQIESGEIVVVELPWAEAKALGILTKLHPKGAPKELRLRPGVAEVLHREKQPDEANFAAAFDRLRHSKRVPWNFWQPNRQNKALSQGEAWVYGKTEEDINQDGKQAEAAKNRANFAKLFPRR